jgi:hypothetical protein
MGRISRGWKLTKLSLGVIRKDKEILIFPVLSALVTFAILASFVAGMFFTVDFEGSADSASPVFLVFGLAFYLVAFFIAFFFNAAVIGCAMIRLNGGDPTVKDGLRIARENIGRIFMWALVAATVGLIIRALQERVGFIGKIVLGFIGMAWTLVTYFVLPVLIYEKTGPWAAVKRSASLIKGSWGETIVGNLGLGLIFLLLGLAGLLPIIIGVAIGGLVAIVVGVVIAVVYWVALAVVASAAQSVLVAALYRYATTGKTSEGFEEIQFNNPW